MARRALEDRFWDFVPVLPKDRCWEWQGTRTRAGYGTIVELGKLLRAHRVSYQLHYGDLQPDLLVRHRCDNPPCVNPAHLRQGTARDNARDRVAHARPIPDLDQETLVLAIREALAFGMSIADTAAVFAVHNSWVRRVAGQNARRRTKRTRQDVMPLSPQIQAETPDGNPNAS
jgi:hypothetical protein